jgi:hypothetical protein
MKKVIEERDKEIIKLKEESERKTKEIEEKGKEDEENKI